MTAMPQMVALFNGVGGGAVALVALAEYHGGSTCSIRLNDTGRGLRRRRPTTSRSRILIPIVLSCVIGAISFAGSMVAFGKLQEVITGRPIVFAAQKIVNGLLFARSW